MKIRKRSESWYQDELMNKNYIDWAKLNLDFKKDLKDVD